MMMKATIEILNETETVLGSPTMGKYMVRYFSKDGEEEGGSFHKTIQEAEAEVLDYQNADNIELLLIQEDDDEEDNV